MKREDETMEYTVRDLVAPAALADTRLGGMSKTISDRFFEERIFSDFAKNVVYKEAEDAFANQIDDAEYIGVWQGEFWGKWVISAAEVYKYTRDASLLAFLQNGAHKLLSYAREDGYLNTYKNSLNVFRVDPNEAKLRCNKRVDWNWNIWCRKYTLWGLLCVYEITEDEAILTGARALADQLIDELAANDIELSDTGTFVGMPSCSILKPMLILYRHTDDQKYLDFCVEHIANRWEREDNTCPNLITNGMSGKRLTDWYPDSDKWAKAYEMMSCYEGICELYRYTGNEKYLRSAEGVYEILKKYELNPSFSVAYNDVFADAADEINLISEPCDAIHWMRLCFELFCLTGDVKYMDTVELAYYNALLAGVFKDGKWGARGIRGAGAHMWSKIQAGLHHQHCCVNNMPRAFMRIAESAVMQTEDAILVNLYETATSNLTYNGGSVVVKLGEGYFESGKIEISFAFTGKRKAIKLRIPAWCKGAEVIVEGKTASVPSGYFTVAPTADILTVCIDFHPTLTLCPFKKDVPQHTEIINGKPHWKLARWINPKAPGETTEDLFLRQKRCTLMYGPLLLARSKVIGNTEEEMFSATPVNPNATCRLVAARGESESARVMFDVEITNGADTLRTTVCDFASAANQKLDDVRFFSIYF